MLQIPWIARGEYPRQSFLDRGINVLTAAGAAAWPRRGGKKKSESYSTTNNGTEPEEPKVWPVSRNARYLVGHAPRVHARFGAALDRVVDLQNGARPDVDALRFVHAAVIHAQVVHARHDLVDPLP